MEIDIRDLEGVTLLPLADGRVAYVDKSGTNCFFNVSKLYQLIVLFQSLLFNFLYTFSIGTVYMCGLKEELLTDEFQTSMGIHRWGTVDGEPLDSSDNPSDAQLILPTIFSDQVCSLKF